MRTRSGTITLINQRPLHGPHRRRRQRLYESGLHLSFELRRKMGDHKIDASWAGWVCRETSAVGDTRHAGPGPVFQNDGGGGRQLSFRMWTNLNLWAPSGEYGHRLTWSSPPFDKPGHFYFNQKINCMRAEGSFNVRRQDLYLDPLRAFAVLDWGRRTYQHLHSSSPSGRRQLGWNGRLWLWKHPPPRKTCLFYDGRLTLGKRSVPVIPWRRSATLCPCGASARRRAL